MTAVTLLWLFACVAANLVGGGVSWAGGTLILLALLLIIGGIWTARALRRAQKRGDVDADAPVTAIVAALVEDRAAADHESPLLVPLGVGPGAALAAEILPRLDLRPGGRVEPP